MTMQKQHDNKHSKRSAKNARTSHARSGKNRDIHVGGAYADHDIHRVRVIARVQSLVTHSAASERRG